MCGLVAPLPARPAAASPSAPPTEPGPVPSSPAQPAQPQPGPAPSGPAGSETLQAELAALQQRLDQARAAQENAERNSQIAAEQFLRAQQELQARERDAALAGRRAVEAERDRDAAQRELAAIAVEIYRGGGTPNGLESVLTTGQLGALASRAEVLRLLGRDQNRAVQRATATRDAAQRDRAAADVARRAQAQATDALHRAAQEAEASSQAAATLVATTDRERQDAIARLAALRQTSLADEQRRQDALVGRAEAKARGTALDRARRLGDPGPEPGVDRAAVEQAIAFAEDKLGTPYLWGGTGPRYDCSGLVMRAYEAAGLTTGRTTMDQYARLPLVPLDRMSRGDLIFYGKGTDAASVYHVAIYLGSDLMIESPHTGADVRIAPVRYTNVMPYVARL